MIEIVLTVLCFSGFVYAACHWLKIEPYSAPLFSISFIGVVLYFFAVFNHLLMGTSFLIFTGFVLSVFWVPVYLQKRREKKLIPLFKFSTVFLILIIISFVLTIKMTFTVVDDYVYWGIMGKYLYLNNHLPVTGCPLDGRILAYTPGTSLIHYFFYLLTGKYSVHISYFAQNMILISAMFVVVRTENIKKSIAYIGFLIVLMTVFAGSVFTKLQVDYLLSIVSFSIFWSYCSQKNIFLRLLTVSMPVCFLFLIKEIGFVLGLIILAIIFFDVWIDNHIDKKDKVKAMGFILLIGGTLFLLRHLWFNHVSAMGFATFHNAIQWESIKNAVHIFSDSNIQKGFLIYIKEVFIGSADRLNIPYLFWYGVIGFLWHRILKTLQRNENSRFFLFTGLVLISLILYLFLLYCMQVIIFGVGSSSDHTAGFSRYLNILFSPIVFIMIISFFDTIVFTAKEVTRKICIILIGIIILVLGISRIEVSLHRENQDTQIQHISRKIEKRIQNDTGSVGVLTQRKDGVPNLQFLYHLLPIKVDYVANSFSNETELVQYMMKYDYILLYNPEPVILDWLKPYVGEKSGIEKISFFRVQQDKPENKRSKKVSLERILL